MDKYIDSKFIILYFEMYCFITPTPFQEIKREKEREIKLQYKKKMKTNTGIQFLMFK